MRGKAAWAWRWFWFILVRNRFAIAIASLVWLIWRSGSQPRRLAYPCQQAAAANLGVFAVLFIPAFARRRRRHHASMMPRAFQLATGSVALAGVLFILISVGAAVYSDCGDSYTPGNPALLAWPRLTSGDLELPDHSLSPRLLAPGDEESVVALNRNDDVTYGAAPAYGPGADTAYDLVWQTVADLHFGPWSNPLRDLVEDVNGPAGVADGKISVVLKPNWVQYFALQPGGEGDAEGRCPSYTHPAMMRPLVDMAVQAARQAGFDDGQIEIIIGDSSGDPYNGHVGNMGYTALVTALNAIYPDVVIPAPVNFQNRSKFTWISLGTGTGQESAYAGSSCSSSDLAKGTDPHANSYFNATDGHGAPGPGKANCMGAYAVTDYLLDADLIVDMPKVKVHFHGVNTLALKNWVGTTMLSTYDESWVGVCRISHYVDSPTMYEQSFGDDIMWREVVDLHRIALYWARGSGIQAAPHRKYLCVLDGIVCGETHLSPPTHWRANTVLASVDPVALEAVGSRIQRYKFDQIPIANNANAESDWPIGTSDPAKLRVVSGTGTMIDAAFNHLSVFDDSHDPGLTWPDWSATELYDLTPPAINSATTQDMGGGDWLVQANISNAHVAFYYYGDDGNGAPYVVRLGKVGDTFSATINGDAGDGVFVAQDDYFNTATSGVVNEPTIGLSTHQLDQTIHYGDDPSNDSFTVRNIGTGTLSYNLEVIDEPGWVGVEPDSGQSNGEEDPITVSYAAGLLPETYVATIRVSASATNSPQDVTVTLIVETVSPDFDLDGDVDQEDFGHFQGCLTGQGEQVAGLCADADLDGDNDADQNDFAVLQGCMSGPNVIPEETCDDL